MMSGKTILVVAGLMSGAERRIGLALPGVEWAERAVDADRDMLLQCRAPVRTEGGDEGDGGGAREVGEDGGEKRTVGMLVFTYI